MLTELQELLTVNCSHQSEPPFMQKTSRVTQCLRSNPNLSHLPSTHQDASTSSTGITAMILFIQTPTPARQTLRLASPPLGFTTPRALQKPLTQMPSPPLRRPTFPGTYRAKPCTNNRRHGHSTGRQLPGLPWSTVSQQSHTPACRYSLSMACTKRWAASLGIASFTSSLVSQA